MTDHSLGSHILEMEKTYSLLLPIHYQYKIIPFSTFPKQDLMQNRIKYNFISSNWEKNWLVRKGSSSSFVTVHFPVPLITGYNNTVHLLKAGTCFRAWLVCSLRVRLVPKKVLILLFPILMRSPLHYTDNLLIYRLLFLHKS